MRDKIRDFQHYGQTTLAIAKLMGLPFYRPRVAKYIVATAPEFLHTRWKIHGKYRNIVMYAFHNAQIDLRENVIRCGFNAL